jgi:hypothetical protein
MARPAGRQRQKLVEEMYKMEEEMFKKNKMKDSSKKKGYKYMIMEEENDEKNKMIRQAEKRRRKKEMMTEKFMKIKIRSRGIRQRRREGYSDDGGRKD